MDIGAVCLLLYSRLRPANRKNYPIRQASCHGSNSRCRVNRCGQFRYPSPLPSPKQPILRPTWRRFCFGRPYPYGGYARHYHWEAPPAVLFGGSLSSAGTGSAQQTKLPDQMVSAKGTVSVPFIGDIAVVGKTPVQVQDLIKGRLKKMANQPQAIVRIMQNNAATVSVIRAGNSVRMPLTTAGERVLDAVAAVGGSTANVQDTNVQLTRGNQVKTVALEDLVANPRQNIMLRRGDIVTMITNPSSFTSMGAVGRTQQIGFSVKGLSLAEAVGRHGRAADRRADARGVFCFPLRALVGAAV